MKKFLFAIASIAILLSACDYKLPEFEEKSGEEKEVVDNTTGDVLTFNQGDTVSGTWKNNSTITLKGTVIIPEGGVLTIGSGSEIIADNQVDPVQIINNGKLYIKGMKIQPTVFTIPENLRADGKQFKGKWGGIVNTSKATELYINAAIFEYAGATLNSDSYAVTQGYCQAEPTSFIKTSSPNSKVVIRNSTFQYLGGDANAIWFNGVKAIVQSSKFIGIGTDGGTKGNAIYMTGNSKVDFAYNLVYSPAQSAVYSEGKQTFFELNGEEGSYKSSAPVENQPTLFAYNNTIINAGWRCDQTVCGIRNAPILAVYTAQSTIYNTMMVNCRYAVKQIVYKRTRTVNGIKFYDKDRTLLSNYNSWKYGVDSLTVAGQKKTDEEKASNEENVDPFRYFLTEGSNDVCGGDYALPKFANYPLETAYDTFIDFDNNWDFSLKSGSKALTVGLTPGNISSLYSIVALEMGGVKYYTQKPSRYIGAFSLEEAKN